MMLEKRENQLLRVLEGIDDAYLKSAMELLSTDSPEKKNHGIAGAVFAAAAEVFVLVMGVFNVANRRGDNLDPVQTLPGEQETEGLGIVSSDNDLQLRESLAGGTLADEEGDGAEEESQREDGQDTLEGDANLEERICLVLEMLYPERSEMYFEALAQRNARYYQGQQTMEEYKEEQMAQFVEEQRKNRQTVREYIAECISAGEEQCQVVERLEQWAAAYPELTDEQEQIFNERYKLYEEYYNTSAAPVRDVYPNQFIFIALYYDLLGRQEEELCVIFETSVEGAEKLVDTDWREIETDEPSLQGNPYCYGYVSARALLELVEAGKAPQIFFLREDIAYPQINIVNNRESVATAVQYEKHHGQFRIRRDGDKESFSLCAYYDI